MKTSAKTAVESSRAPASFSGRRETSVRRIVRSPGLARLWPWGMRDFGEILALQEKLHADRVADHIPDTWLAGEHPTVITHGVRGGDGDIVRPGAYPIFSVDRGGQTTLHNPGQLVIYPIIKTAEELRFQAWYARALVTTIRNWLAERLGISLEMIKGRPGLFLEGRKAAAIGVSIRRHVSMHGIAINVCNDLRPWGTIVACGETATRPVTLSEIVGRRIATNELIATLPEFLNEYWGYELVDVKHNDN